MKVITRVRMSVRGALPSRRGIIGFCAHRFSQSPKAATRRIPRINGARTCELAHGYYINTRHELVRNVETQRGDIDGNGQGHFLPDILPTKGQLQTKLIRGWKVSPQQNPFSPVTRVYC